MKMQSYLGRARALGSTNNGAHHWISQRLTAIALVPLGLWFVFSVIGLIGADYAAYKEWLGSHGNFVLLSLFTTVAFYHAQLGLQVVIEDYMQGSCRLWALISMRFAIVLFGFASVTAIFRVAFGG